MKLSIVTVAVATLAPVALARTCKGGLYYCGQTLLNIDYRAQIVQALRDAGKPIDDKWVRGALFFCTGYDGGDIDFSKNLQQYPVQGQWRQSERYMLLDVLWEKKQGTSG